MTADPLNPLRTSGHRTTRSRHPDQGEYMTEAPDRWTSPIGPCAVCGVLIRRYGPEGGPLCDDCSAKITTRKETP